MRVRATADQRVEALEKELAAAKLRAARKKAAGDETAKRIMRISRSLRTLATKYGESEFAKCCSIAADEMDYEVQRLAGQLEMFPEKESELVG